MGDRSHQVECRSLDRANRFEHLRRALQRSGVAPDDAAHLLVVKVLGERRSRRNGQEREESVQLLRRLLDEAAIPLHDCGRVLELPEHRSGVVGVHGMPLEEERRDDAEVAAASADGPEEVRVLFGARGDEAAVGEHHVHGEDAVDAQAVLTRQVPDAATEREPAHAGRRDDARGHGQAEWVSGMIDVAPERSAAARIVFFFGSTRTYRIGERSITSPSSQTPRPMALWPPPRIDTSSFCSRAKFTAVCTSATSAQLRDQPGPAVDHSVVDLACLVVLRVGRRDELAAQRTT